MIACIEGTIMGVGRESAIVMVGGMGLEVGMPAGSLSKLPEAGSHVRLFTHLQVRDDGLSLFGFASQEEKRMFEALIGVTSVGPKMALAALSTFSADTLSSAIMAGDVAQVSQIPGVGKKKAQRIILELQGTLAQDHEEVSAVSGAPSVVKAVVEDLLAMGFTQAESDLAVKDAPEGSEAQVLQYALKRLGQ